MARKLWAGLDVGVESTSLCVINDDGEILQETTCPTALESIHREIRWIRRRRFARVGMEASTPSCIARGLRSKGYSIDLYETRQLSKFLRVRRNKTDAGDAVGIAEAGRIGTSLVSSVHMKSLDCQSLQSRLAIRRCLVRARVAAINLLCRQFELYGGRIPKSKRSMQLRDQMEAEIRRLFGRASTPLTQELHRLLDHCEQTLKLQRALDQELLRCCAQIEVCRRFMEIPGVGPICALTFYASVGDPHRFRRSADIGSYLGLTPRLFQSGLTSRLGHITKQGNRQARSILVQAAVAFMRCTGPESPLRCWTLRIEKERGRGKARVALARKLATIMLAMWKNDERFRPDRLDAGVLAATAPDSERRCASPNANLILEPALLPSLAIPLQHEVN